MGMAEMSPRMRLPHAAEAITYRRGFGKTALADIAKAAEVPPGNVYYYFKTKNQIANAIIDLKMARFKKLLEQFNRASSPKDRLCAFVDTKIEKRGSLAHSGCPVGTLCSELHKHGGPIAEKSTSLFAEALDWMEAQFQLIGMGEDSRDLAVHLLSSTQGISLLAHTFHDPRLIEIEAERLKQWIRLL
jgi:AcrR family transcriptional regulator